MVREKPNLKKCTSWLISVDIFPFGSFCTAFIFLSLFLYLSPSLYLLYSLPISFSFLLNSGFFVAAIISSIGSATQKSFIISLFHAQSIGVKKQTYKLCGDICSTVFDSLVSGCVWWLLFFWMLRLSNAIFSMNSLFFLFLVFISTRSRWNKLTTVERLVSG